MGMPCCQVAFRSYEFSDSGLQGQNNYVFSSGLLGTADWLGAGSIDMVSFALAGHYSCALQLCEPAGCTLLTASHVVNSSLLGLKLVLKFTSVLMAIVLQKP